MKTKMLSLVPLFAAGAVFATPTEFSSSYVIGAMPVSLASGQTEAIISIPWVESGAATEGIAVSNIVKTANLTDGDMLYWYNTSTSSWDMWYLTTGTGDVKYWQSVSTSDTSGDELGGFHKVDASATPLNRGEAILLKRSGTTATTIYVIGQYSASATESLTIAKGSKASPKVTMIAPPKAAATDLNDATWTNVGSGDLIYIRAGDGGLVKTFFYQNGEWGYETVDFSKDTPVVFNQTAIVPIGCGAFYVSQTDDGSAPTMQWPAAN